MSEKKKRLIIGIDLGGTKMLIALYNRKFQLLGTVKVKTEVSRGSKVFVRKIVDGIENLLDDAKAKPKSLLGIGVGCPGIIDHAHGVVTQSPNIRFLRNFPLAKSIKRFFKVPVVIENDVNTGLFGEHRFGVARGYKHVIGIFPGTGIGGALILNDELYRGATGAAGEIGHVLIDPLGPKCGCGRRGCLEALTGRLAVASEAATLALKQQARALFKIAGADVSEIKSGSLAKAIKSGDDAIRELMIHKSRILGVAMANAVNLLNPELIVLGGGLVEAMANIIVPEARDSMREHGMKPTVSHVRVAPAELGDYAIVLGAAKLAQESVERNSEH